MCACVCVKGFWGEVGNYFVSNAAVLFKNECWHTQKGEKSFTCKATRAVGCVSADTPGKRGFGLRAAARDDAALVACRENAELILRPLQRNIKGSKLAHAIQRNISRISAENEGGKK